jgi:hypothetical protein
VCVLFDFGIVNKRRFFSMERKATATRKEKTKEIER